VRRLSLRARLVLGLLVLAAIGLVAADVATYTSLRSFLFDQTDQTLEQQHRFADQAVGGNPSDRRGGPRLPPGMYVEIRSLSGTVVATSFGAPPPGGRSQPKPKFPPASRSSSRPPSSLTPSAT
jgi:two-component system OmpR family sensor kinase